MRITLPLILLLLLASGAGSPAAAQLNQALWIVQVGHVRDPVLTTGFRWIYTPAPVERIDPATGMALPISSRTSLHASGTGGISLAGGRDHAVDWTALASVGFVRPIATGPISGAGLLAMGSLQPDAVGPGIRLETGFRAFGLNAGVLFSSQTTRGAATVDMTAIFLRDLFR